ncbi:MAG TPA: hypothetical protein VMU99_03730 [Acidimicrobiales bacterium]|nr:hypothetical protein [Acidimicrobiales bacterium]
MSNTRRQEALELAEELLSDIELTRIEPMAIVRKASRLARLIDDADALAWLSYESTGYATIDGSLTAHATAMARRSFRVIETDTGAMVHTQMVGEITSSIEAVQTDLSVSGGNTSSSQYAVIVENNKATRRNQLIESISNYRAILDKVLGSIHAYVGERYQELRFGSVVESAFEIVRTEVDRRIGTLVPEALPMITAALENASSDNPEHWQSAAATCRRLLMVAADQLRPPSPDVEGRKMGPGNYINRLIDWIVANATSKTAAEMVTADLTFLGNRLDAADQAGQKGAHVGATRITRVEASRFVTGTYLILGDLLQLAAD